MSSAENLQVTGPSSCSCSTPAAWWIPQGLLEPLARHVNFAAAIKYATEVNGFLVVHAPPLGSPELGNRILVRECYPMLWNRLQQVHAEESWTSFVITGREGVGKTYWLMWLLIRWASCLRVSSLRSGPACRHLS